MKSFVLSFEYGGFGSDNYKIYNNGFDLIVEINNHRINHEEFNQQISSEQWEEFWKVIDEIDKLQNGEAALFLISSGSHKFPEDIEIFNVIPPSLDKMNRWITENQNTGNQANEQQISQDENEGEENNKSNLWTP